VFKGQKITCIIPARMESSRFPGKLLEKVNGKTVLEMTWMSACKINFFDFVSFATDSEEIIKTARSFGASCIKTSENCLNGTDRLIEIFESKKVTSDVWINWQADEPFLTKETIKKLLQTCDESDFGIWTLASKIVSKEEINCLNTVKVVFDNKNKALYFSRLPIPFNRIEADTCYFKHIGIYAYSSKALEKMSQFKQCDLEKFESLEQLRYLYNGFSIKVYETTEETVSINTKKDLRLLQEITLKNTATTGF
jgi:3-deoxy-manno-octulosonate cytidylyltransferase (CMP-KDO synthetase)